MRPPKPGDELRISVPSPMPKPYNSFEEPWQDSISLLHNKSIILECPRNVGKIVGWRFYKISPYAYSVRWVPDEWLRPVWRQGQLFL